jgi:hypothetical protein
MGLMQWMRGGDDSTLADALSGGMAAIDQVFRPTRYQQYEFLQEARRRKVDVAQGDGVDLDRGIVIVRRPKS